MSIYVYTQTASTKQIMQIEAEDLALLKETFHIFGHTYSEQSHGEHLFVFLTASPITDGMRQRIIEEVTLDAMLLKPGERLWLEING